MLPRRTHEISRIEAFSDAVFAFALTLLVVSLQVPKSYDELMNLMSGFPAFACCFGVLLWIWYEHNLFFRRYGLQDPYTVLLNGALLFVVMFYVYPLKFMFDSGFSQFIPKASQGAVPMTLRSSRARQRSTGLGLSRSSSCSRCSTGMPTASGTSSASPLSKYSMSGHLPASKSSVRRSAWWWS